MVGVGLEAVTLCSSFLADLQFVREFAKLGLTRSVGGVLGLALSRELTPVITSIILAGNAQWNIFARPRFACLSVDDELKRRNQSQSPALSRARLGLTKVSRNLGRQAKGCL